MKRIKTKVQWTFVSLNGLATDGEPWTCKREQGKRSAASRASVVGIMDVPSTDPLRQAKSEVPRPAFGVGRRPRGKMALGTFAETKVTRRTGPAPR